MDIGAANLPRYPYAVSSTHSTPAKRMPHNPNTSSQYNPVHRSKSLAVPRSKVHTYPRPERSTTPPLAKSASSDKGLMSWARTGTTELDKFELPKSLTFNNTDSPGVAAKRETHGKTLADILVESVPVKQEYEETAPPPEHERRRSSDDILDTSKYLQENRPIDEYVSLTGTRKKMKSRRVSDPFSGLLPGKSLSADQLDAEFGSPPTGLRSREESIEQLRGSHNNSDSAFTAKLQPQRIPSPTSSEEELRDISGLRGGAAVKRTRSLSSGTQGRPKDSGFSPRHARVKILSNKITSSSLDSTLERGQRAAGVRSDGEGRPDPVYARVNKKGDRGKEAQSKPGSEKRPQPSTIDPSAIRRALIEELKSGHLKLSHSSTEPNYAAASKGEPMPEKIPSQKPDSSSKPLNSGTLAERGLLAARRGDLDTLKELLMSEHTDNPHLVDKRSAIQRCFHLFTDARTESNLVHVTSESGSAGCLKWLVFFAPEGACVALNKDRLVPAILAIRNGSLECVKILVLDAHVPLTIQELGNETLLHHAAHIGQTDILKWLLDYLRETQGNVIKDSDLQDAFGVTPAHFAAQQGYLDCLQVLQDALCNLWTMDQQKQTPMDWAGAAKQDLVANYLIMVRSVRYLSEQLGLERKHSQRLQDKMALVENSSFRMKEDFEEKICVVRDEYEVRRKDLQQDFLLRNVELKKEGKGGKSKKRRGLLRTFSLPAKQGHKKTILPLYANFNSTEESSPEEPRLDTKLFPQESNTELGNPETDPITPAHTEPAPAPRSSEEVLATIEEVSTITHRDSVVQPSEEATPLKMGAIQEITISEEIAPVPDASCELSHTLQRLKEETKTAYRSSPDPFLTEGSSCTTPENTLQRKKRNIGFRTSSKTSLKEDSISRKSAESSIGPPAPVGESTGCHYKVVTALRRIFSNSSRQEHTLNRETAHPVTQSDQVTLQTVQPPLSPNLIETDFIAESEYSSHASVSAFVPHRSAPEPPPPPQQQQPPTQGRKPSYIHATAVQEAVKQQARVNAQPTDTTLPYPASASTAHYAPARPQHSGSRRMSYPGMGTGSQNKLHKLEPYSRQAERLLDSGYLGQSSDSLDAIRQRPKHLGTNPAGVTRATQAYSAPTPQGYLSLPSTPQRMAARKNVSWPNTLYSPQRAATMCHNPYQQTQYSKPGYSTHKSTTISDL